jgi:hypothetical protein
MLLTNLRADSRNASAQSSRRTGVQYVAEGHALGAPQVGAGSINSIFRLFAEVGTSTPQTHPI